jgi:catechol 2,3-dioxygenase-like lactoylglutathione lyase family enzyme
MTESARPRAVGLNHVALEVGDIEEALAFYGRLFRFELRSKSDTMAFIDLGDQFIALQKGQGNPRMTVATLVWSSMTKKRHAALLEMRASRH